VEGAPPKASLDYCVVVLPPVVCFPVIVVCLLAFLPPSGLPPHAHFNWENTTTRIMMTFTTTQAT
jgi:hypothetical protein